jgi:hypothetical protein
MIATKRSAPRSLGRALAALLGLALAFASVSPASARTVGAHRPPPAHWDARIRRIVAFVEHERGLRFKHPIPVRFLSDREFRRALHADDPKVTARDRREAARMAGQLHALGLADSNVNLIKANTALDDQTTLGFYDSQREVMVIRGKKLATTDVRVTVAHELTHALQDQYFDLDKLYDSAKTSGASFAREALIEGDAVWVEDGYVQSLPKAEQDKYYRTGSNGGATQPEPLPPGVPAVLDVFSSVPYVLGPSFVYLLRTVGRGELNNAFRHPPPTDEQIVDPVAWRQHQPALRVPTPKLDPGDTRHGAPDEIGAFTLYLMLASRLDVATALRAATGWGGDRYVGFGRAGRECVRAGIRGDRPRDVDEIAAALTAWAGKLPPGAATVTRKGETVELTSCETAGVTAPDPKVLDDAVFASLDNRLILTADFIGSFGAGIKHARCAADRMVSDPQLGPLIQRVYAEGIRPQDLPPADQRTFTQLTKTYLTACGVT